MTSNNNTPFLILTLLIGLSSCEQVGDVTPTPDAPAEDVPDTGPGQDPSAGNPLTPDERIECALETGHRSYFDGAGRETQRWTFSIASAGTTLPTGTPWLCYDSIPDTDCRSLESCEDVGEVTAPACSVSSWGLSESGQYYVNCGIRQELDLDGDGVFELQADAPIAHVAIVY